MAQCHMEPCTSYRLVTLTWEFNRRWNARTPSGGSGGHGPSQSPPSFQRLAGQAPQVLQELSACPRLWALVTLQVNSRCQSRFNVDIFIT